MKLYYPKTLYNSSYRALVFPLLKEFIKSKDFTDIQRVATYGVSDTTFIFVNKIEDSHVVILPMAWNYYSQTKLLNLAFDLIMEANQKGKQVWSFNAGDFGVKVPYFKNLTVFRQGGYMSNNQLGHQGFPCIIDDYLKHHDLQDYFLNNSYQSKPIVGFCGQANPSKYNASKEVFFQILRNLKTRLNLSYLESQKILSSTYLRSSLLHQLEQSTNVNSLFLIRKQYRAGVKKNKSNHKTTKEFYENIIDSQYVLCVRGAGNFSVRFYETLMMGRIPLYVHTDGYLPLSNDIDWKKHLVWVDYEDKEHIVDILLNFHRQLDKGKLIALLKSNRKLWEEKLTLGGFFETFISKT